jgi:hypothetical protein
MPHLFRAVKEPFAHHGCWHRMRDPNVPDPVRQRCFPKLIPLGKPGSGAQFLEFHRHMIRHFKWFVANTPGPRYAYRPWQELPHWIKGILDAWHPDFVPETLAEIEVLIRRGTLDDLGKFIEGDGPKVRPGGLHAVLHLWISQHELALFGKHPESDMGSLQTAPFNEHFWDAHGWIDAFYARWQELHGEVPDLSPVPPHTPAPKLCDECLQKTPPSKFDAPILLLEELLNDSQETTP